MANLGGYYQADNGVFICPYSGTYAFSFSFLSTEGDQAAGALYIDGTQYARAWGDDPETWSHGSNMFVASCSAGSQVYVQAYGASSFLASYYTVFAGFILQRYE